VAGNDDGIVGKGKQFVVQGPDNLLERTARQVGPADASRKQRIAGDQFFLHWKIKADASFGMAWSEKHIRRERAGPDRIGLSDALINLHFARRRHADPCGLDIEHLEQTVIVLIEQNWRAGCGPQFHGAAHVVDVRVGDYDLLYLQVVLSNQRENALDFIAGIDDHGFARGLVPNNGAVALQRADGKDFVDHDDQLLVAGRPSLAGRVAMCGQTTKDERPRTYFCGTGAGGVAGGAAGFTGCDLAGAALTPCNTEFVPLWREAKTESVIEVTINMTADHVVARDKAVAAPRGPKAVWLPMPPKAAAMSPLLPLCNNTTMMRNKQTAM